MSLNKILNAGENVFVRQFPLRKPSILHSKQKQQTHQKVEIHTLHTIFFTKLLRGCAKENSSITTKDRFLISGLLPKFRLLPARRKSSQMKTGKLPVTKRSEGYCERMCATTDVSFLVIKLEPFDSLKVLETFHITVLL